MHGRLKVKTTAEQQEAKRKEREKKLKIYNGATGRAFEKRKNGEFDEESLKITGEILAVNPDFYTLWNYRKETFLHLKETRPAEEMKGMFEDELQFLESCLRVNPKSYGSWNHRCFVMTVMPEPDWKTELELCNLFLEYDERNFHCWDYRRFVVKQSKVSAEDELEYTTNKICNNFSNFSSWHYRSKLLPVIHPDSASPVGVQDQVLIKEYETVQNAFFTDPDDQSAWFYHRWLLGRGEKKQDISSVYLTRERLLFTTTQPLKVGSACCRLTVTVSGTDVPGVWCNHRNNQAVFSSIWIFTPSERLAAEDVTVCLVAEEADWNCTRTISLAADTTDSSLLTHPDPGARFSHELSAATSSTLERELESIQELFELEPENKWVLLTIVSLMKALDPVRYTEEVKTYIDTLQTIDSTRLAYYRDLRSKFVIENFLEQYDFGNRVISLAHQRLTALCHPELFVMVTELDLSDNNLHSLKSFSCLQCVQKLCLDNNQLTEVTELQHLPDLTDLSVKNNMLSSIDAIQDLSECAQLVLLKLEGNLVVDQGGQDIVRQLLPRLKFLDDTQLT